MSETYGEDPRLSYDMAAAFVKSLQGSDPTYLKATATCKHWIGNDLEGRGAAGSATRYNFNAQISAADLRDSYLPPFEACVKAGKVAAVMCAYNAGEWEGRAGESGGSCPGVKALESRWHVNPMPPCTVNGLPSCANPSLFNILRQQWGFTGHVVTDCTGEGGCAGLAVQKIP